MKIALKLKKQSPKLPSVCYKRYSVDNKLGCEDKAMGARREAIEKVMGGDWRKIETIRK